jgi:hypothetical protein
VESLFLNQSFGDFGALLIELVRPMGTPRQSKQTAPSQCDLSNGHNCSPPP